MPYYLRIDGLSGDSTAAGHEGWFEIDYFDLSVARGTGLSSGGLVGGSPNYEPVSVGFSLDSALASLLQNMSSGKQFTSVQIEGVNFGSGAPSTFFELTLNNVSTSTLFDFSQGGFDATFDFEQIGVVTSDASGTVTSSAGWDLVAQKALDPTTLEDAIEGTSGHAAGTFATAYYVWIEGITGDVTDVGHKGWFRAETLVTNFDASSGSIFNSEGVSLVFSNDSALTRLMSSLASGKMIDSIVIEGVTTGKTTQVVYALDLESVVVSSLSNSDASFDNQGFNAFFDYQQIGITTNEVDENGILSSDTFGFDVVTGKSVTVTSSGSPSSSPAGSVQEVNRYFLLIDGVTGDSLDASHKGWFEIDAVSLGAVNSGQFLFGSGLVSGKNAFSEVQISAHMSGALAAWLASMGSSKSTNAIRIEGVAIESGKQSLVYEMTLNDVMASALSSSGSSGGGFDLSFALSYSKIGLISTGVDAGLNETQFEFGWDIASAKSIDPTTLDAPSSGPILSIPTDTNGTSNQILEGDKVGTVVGITAASSGTSGITYSLTGANAGLFAIDATSGVITVAGAIDREALGASLAVTVLASASGATSKSSVFNILIGDVNEFSVSAPSDSNVSINTVDENSKLGTVVGLTAFASDADATTNAVTYSLTSNPGGLFAIDKSTGIVTVGSAIDYETVGALITIEVTATSAGGSSKATSFDVAIGDLNGVLLAGDATDEILTGTEEVDILNGRAGNDTLYGLGGNDLLIGTSGNDILDGGTGDDRMVGGGWNDTYYVDSARDRVYETTTTDPANTTDAGGTDLIISQVTINLNATIGVSFVENLTLVGGADLDGYGNSLGNTLTGNSGNNVLRGRGGDDILLGEGGNDILDGEAGNDWMLGGAGNDTYFVQDERDRVYETLTMAGGSSDAGGYDRIFSWVSLNLDAYEGLRYVERLFLKGTGAINGFGNDLANTIVGNNSDNRMIGRAGNDILKGNRGADIIQGDGGRDLMFAGTDEDRDVFVFLDVSDTAVGSARDRIYQFDSGEDQINLVNIDADTSLGGDQAFTFSLAGPAANAIWLVANGSHQIVAGDVTGDGVQDFEIWVLNVGGLTTADFVL